LTVMQKRAEKTKSKVYREFLLGYVSAVRSGGNIINYLRSKLPNSAGYEDGVKLSWNSNNGLGVSSVYVPYMLKVLVPTFNATLNDAVNITTTLKVQGFCTVGENETLKNCKPNMHGFQ